MHYFKKYINTNKKVLAIVILLSYYDYNSKITKASKERGGGEVMMKIKLRDVDGFKKMLIVKGFSQRSLGRKIGISEPYSNQVCNGIRNPGPEIAKNICKALDLQFDDIFFIENACNSDHASTL
jgi:DNA-binding XRE family transcriptional regulator